MSRAQSAFRSRGRGTLQSGASAPGDDQRYAYLLTLMHTFGAEEIMAAQRVLETRRLFRYMPDAVEADEFERELAACLATRHAVLVSSGTAALVCALSALGIGPGDEVLISAYGFVGDALAVLAVGAVPIACEVDASLTIDPRDIARRATSRTRAVLPVHMNGFPCDMDAILALARARGIAVVEDACQAIGGSYRGRALGSIGDLGTFSFNQHKIITAGEGGAVVTDNQELYERSFITHDGSCSFSRHQLTQPVFAGMAFRASEITAVILRVQLTRLESILAALRRARDDLHAVLSLTCAIEHVPVHDWQGSCATCLAYAFEDGLAARRFRDVAEAAGLDTFVGAAHGHSYAEWDVLHERRGGHSAAANPLATTGADLSPDACPQTAEVLERTILVRCEPDIDLDRLRETLASRWR